MSFSEHRPPPSWRLIVACGLLLLTAPAALVLALLALYEWAGVADLPRGDSRQPPVVIVAGATRYPVLRPEVVDGDTLDAIVLFPYGVACQARLRASDYDAWESSRARRTVTITDDELARGRLAADGLRRLLETGRAYIEPDRPGGSRDAYGRLLGRWFLLTPTGEWIEVAGYMRRAGHVRDAAPAPEDRPPAKNFPGNAAFARPRATLCRGPGLAAIPESCDLIEKNRVWPPDARRGDPPPIDQVIFWEWRPELGQFVVRDWSLAEQCGPVVRTAGGMLRVELRRDAGVLAVEAPRAIATDTAHDPERDNLRLVPKECRRPLRF